MYLHIMLNISKHYLGRNADLLPTVCVACWNFVRTAWSCLAI